MENEIDKVKRKLWSFGYACKDVSDVPGLGYDLLVENEHQVKVIGKDGDVQSISKKIVVAVVEGMRYDITFANVEYVAKNLLP